MLTRSVVLATTLTVGLVAGVGSSAIAVALIPGDASGSTQPIEAIASPMQDPAEGSSGWFVESTPVTLSIARPVVIDGGGDEPAAKVDPAAEHAPITIPTPTPTPPAAASDTGTENANDGVGAGDVTSPSNPGSSADDKKDKSKKDKEDKAKKDKEDKAKKDKDQSDGAGVDQ